MKNIPLIMRLIKEANETAQAADRKVSSAEGDSEMSFNTATSASNVTQTAKNVRFMSKYVRQMFFKQQLLIAISYCSNQISDWNSFSLYFLDVLLIFYESMTCPWTYFTFICFDRRILMTWLPKHEDC